MQSGKNIVARMWADIKLIDRLERSAKVLKDIQEALEEGELAALPGLKLNLTTTEQQWLERIQ